ncbi:MAG TPA: hypothetical protein VLK30_09855 [Candidatus Limnocylindrales bacterium]|nr:hypothetical protein [Candidatus Limnocylindrales bacterium]
MAMNADATAALRRLLVDLERPPTLDEWTRRPQGSDVASTPSVYVAAVRSTDERGHDRIAA